MNTDINSAIKYFVPDPIHGGIAFTGPFCSLSLSLHIYGDENGKRQFQNIRAIETSISEDIWNISCLVHRIDMFNKLAQHNKDYVNLWRMYLAVDIDMIHVQLRSILDNVANLVSITASKKGQVPTSFNDLCNKLDKYSHLIDSEIVTIVKTSSWFNSIREIRDNLVHRNGRTLIFGEPNEVIGFQTYDRMMNGAIRTKGIMINDNIANFNWYIAVTMARVLTLISELSSILIKKYNAKPTPDTYMTSPGLQILLEWMQDYKTANGV